MHSEKVRIRNWIACFIWLTLIFIIASIPAAPIMNAYTQLKSVILRFLLSDPVTHLIMFGILAFLLGHSFRKSFPLMGKRNSILWVLLVSFLLALVMEVYQQLIIPGRTFEMTDIIWDLVGIGVAIIYLFIAFPKTMESSHSIS